MAKEEVPSLACLPAYLKRKFELEEVHHHHHHQLGIKEGRFIEL
jgi:hypothetical protein